MISSAQIGHFIRGERYISRNRSNYKKSHLAFPVYQIGGQIANKSW